MLSVHIWFVSFEVNLEHLKRVVSTIISEVADVLVQLLTFNITV